MAKGASGTFPVYISPQLLAQLASDASKRGIYLGNRPAFSTFLRQLLEQLAGPESEWRFQDSDAAVLYLEGLGFSTAQFTKPRFARAQAREHLAEELEDATERVVEQKIPGMHSRIEELTTKLLDNSITSEEEDELERLTGSNDPE
jgi:hypothetical protein